MRAGLLRYPIDILQATKTKGLSGESVPVWSLFCSTKSNVLFKSGDKKISDNQFINGRVVDFTIRYNILITEQMRVKYEGNIYKVIFINPNILTGSKIITCDYLEKA